MIALSQTKRRKTKEEREKKGENKGNNKVTNKTTSTDNNSEVMYLMMTKSVKKRNNKLMRLSLN